MITFGKSNKKGLQMKTLNELEIEAGNIEHKIWGCDMGMNDCDEMIEWAQYVKCEKQEAEYKAKKEEYKKEQDELKEKLVVVEGKIELCKAKNALDEFEL